ncbi:CPBP family glutamic-type intramembrane protease [Microterricola viridarii]|uniref:Abortive phage infection protein n=1 Tax=Microterricola viridarii TaxID=412690 RepID=A0A0X8E234_9MICO|nr:CPBP family glutamic-type intramembrane protease [Microterricola viridarii]AMB58990.1 abortive phage infection protein [Microterricola viridarii]
MQLPALSPHAPDAAAPAVLTWKLLPAALVCGAAVLLFGVQIIPVGYAMLLAGVASAWFIDRALFRDLLLIALGQLIISTISLEANIDYPNMVLFTVVLGSAVAVPYLVQRFIYKERVIRFPWRGSGRWTRAQWIYIGAVVVMAIVLLPFYFISSGAYQNWPAVHEPDAVIRLFIGVNAVGIWDELFFICTVFTLLCRHFPVWLANALQATVFVSFLWELGYQSWGPLLTIPFALVQGMIFRMTRSLSYVVTVHLLFDLVVFLVIVYAHNPEWFGG